MSAAAVIAWAVNPSSPSYPLYGPLFLLGATSAGGDAGGEAGVRVSAVRGDDSSFVPRGQLISKMSLRFYLHSWECLRLETRERSCNTAALAPGANEGMCQGEHVDDDNSNNALGWLGKNTTCSDLVEGTLSPGVRDRNVDSFVCIERGDQVPE